MKLYQVRLSLVRTDEVVSNDGSWSFVVKAEGKREAISLAKARFFAVFNIPEKSVKVGIKFFQARGDKKVSGILIDPLVSDPLPSPLLLAVEEGIEENQLAKEFPVGAVFKAKRQIIIDGVPNDRKVEGYSGEKIKFVKRRSATEFNIKPTYLSVVEFRKWAGDRAE